MSSLLTDVKDWTLEKIINYIKKERGASFIEKNEIKTKFEKQQVNGISFLRFTEEKLTRKPGPFEFLYGPAEEIMLLVEKLKDPIGDLVREFSDFTVEPSESGETVDTVDTVGTVESRNAGESAKISLHQLYAGQYNDRYIKQDDMLFYEKHFKAINTKVSRWCKVKHIDDKGKISVSTPINNKENFDSLNDLESSILEEYKVLNNLQQDLPVSKKAHVYTFVIRKLGSVFELRKKYLKEQKAIRKD